MAAMVVVDASEETVRIGIAAGADDIVDARAVVQAGIIAVVISAERMREYTSDYYNEHFGMVEVLFGEAGIGVRRV